MSKISYIRPGEGELNLSLVHIPWYHVNMYRLTGRTILLPHEEGYRLFRGNCKKFVDAFIAEFPELEAVRGNYLSMVWGPQPHWWCRDRNTGRIIDPTLSQFPDLCLETDLQKLFYVEFDGYGECEYCGKHVHEDDAYISYHHFYCSYHCYGLDVM